MGACAAQVISTVVGDTVTSPLVLTVGDCTVQVASVVAGAVSESAVNVGACTAQVVSPVDGDTLAPAVNVGACTAQVTFRADGVTVALVPLVLTNRYAVRA